MLPRQYRLPALDIPRVMRDGKRINIDGLGIVYRVLNIERPLFRFAFIVSTKVDKRATARNRIKRLLRESVRHVLPQITTPVDGVIIGGKGLVGVSQRDIEIRVKELLKSVGVIQEINP